MLCVFPFVCCVPEIKKETILFAKQAISRRRVKYWEIIADNLSKAGWSWGCISVVDSRGRTIFVADAHRGEGHRFTVHADEKLTAFPRRHARGSEPARQRSTADFSRMSANGWVSVGQPATFRCRSLDKTHPLACCLPTKHFEKWLEVSVGLVF
jgi:hypothetical protein